MSNVSKPNTQLLVRGSVVKVRRHCGKTRCKCAQGELHETWALSYSHQGKTKMIPLRPEDIRLARQAIKRYQKAFTLLESQAVRGINHLHATIKAAKRRAQ
jgi:hypothetical protein